MFYIIGLVILIFTPIILALRNIPEGYQDDEGFHYGKQKRPAADGEEKNS